MKKKKYVFLEFSINRITLGKVYFELFNDEEIKKSVNNFLNLCKGQDYHSIYSNEILSYKNCMIEKIKKGKCIKTGYLRNKININDNESYYNKNNINNNNNDDNYDNYDDCNSIDNIYNSLKNKMKKNKTNKYEKVECIYGNYYNKEYSKRKHTCAGLLTMIQIEDKKYSSIFKITLNKTYSYNNKNIIIGQVIKNMHILRAIEMLPTYNNGTPKVHLYISDCNEVNESFFKKEKISSRQMYINQMFEMSAKQSAQNDIANVDNNNDNNFIYEQHTYNHSYDDYTIKKKSYDNFNNEHINEKQRGIILLNKIFQQIDDHIKNDNNLMEKKKKNKNEKDDTLQNDDNLQNDYTLQNDDTLQNDNVKSDYFDKEQKDLQNYKSFKENDKNYNKNQKHLDCSMSQMYQLSSFHNHENHLNKQMTDRERKLLNIQMKINQSKMFNHMEIKKEKMHERIGLASTHRFDEYMKYKYEKNVNITDVHSKGVKQKGAQQETGSILDEQKEDIINTARGKTNNNTHIDGNNNNNNNIYDDDNNNTHIDDNNNTYDDGNNNYKRDKLYNISAFNVKKIMLKKNKKKDDTYQLDNDTNLYKKIKFNFSINRKIYDEKKKIYGSNFYNINLLNHENTKGNEYDKNKVVEFCKKQEELRSKISRKRKEKEGIFKNYINQRNKIYNKKLDRYFNKHTLEIRKQLENPS
ncbi:peptidyl-prolyl cis-trans isomerase [Plasmodium gaboni]|uniref:Peptidyl-prolyl cis-trans isomerase n=1 Tax=Plasmodium gaboni TaxID=647221 RepID=A0A151LN77_9APIC|nr:peptidyl-prolyl cis-trans isomerase [Plasmodium gaboni]KYO00634.1 peptidyl-prolyl cis-trans isomerase [Plasmodium gaboni]